MNITFSVFARTTRVYRAKSATASNNRRRMVE